MTVLRVLFWTVIGIVALAVVGVTPAEAWHAFTFLVENVPLARVAFVLILVLACGASACDRFESRRR